MGFLRRLFGGKEQEEEYRDPQGLYFYVECDNCGAQVKVRADKQYDLGRRQDGYEWHKTIVDSQCFKPMQTVVLLDERYNVIEAEIDGGHYISEDEYNAPRDSEQASAEEDKES